MFNQSCICKLNAAENKSNMKELEFFKYDAINEKLDFLIKLAWELLQKKIQYGLIEINKEASLQLQYASILQSLITTSQYYDGEIVKIFLEKTVYVKNMPQEVDIIVEAKKDNKSYKITTVPLKRTNRSLK